MSIGHTWIGGKAPATAITGVCTRRLMAFAPHDSGWMDSPIAKLPSYKSQFFTECKISLGHHMARLPVRGGSALIMLRHC